MRAVLHFFDNNGLAGGTAPIQRTIVPYWKDAIGLGRIVCHTKSKTKMLETVTDLLMTNLSLTTGSHQARLLQKVISTMVSIHLSQ
jgi:hypothetical protein